MTGGWGFKATGWGVLYSSVRGVHAALGWYYDDRERERRKIHALSKLTWHRQGLIVGQKMRRLPIFCSRIHLAFLYAGQISR